MEGKKASLIKTQQLLVFVSLALFVIKITAWYITSSVAILTDALESIVNIIAGFIGLYSIIISAKPKDKEHPYGHGKVEFISSAFEGILISVAGLIIIYEAINNFIHPHTIKKLDYGLILIAFSAVINYSVGVTCVKKGTKENSQVLVAGGKHLISDTYSTIGLIAGVLLLLLTGYKWIDSAVAMLFAFIIIFTGYKIIRKAISGMMDEADDEIIEEVKNVLNTNTQANWIDVHNMRIINYVGFYHIDCHLTVPFYLTISQGHAVLDELTLLLSKHFKENVEFFIHVDACQFYQCSICQVLNCTFRKENFIQTIEWTSEKLISNNKHKMIIKNI
jgi:cation diffusion facilitator family transporter